MKAQYEQNTLLGLLKQEGSLEAAVKTLVLGLVDKALGPMQSCLAEPNPQSFLTLEETLSQAALQTSSLLVVVGFVQTTAKRGRGKRNTCPTEQMYRRPAITALCIAAFREMSAVRRCAKSVAFVRPLFGLRFERTQGLNSKKC